MTLNQGDLDPRPSIALGDLAGGWFGLACFSFMGLLATACVGDPADPPTRRTIDLTSRVPEVFRLLEDDRTSVTDMIPLADGSVILLADTAPFVERVDADGNRLVAFGRAGAGPGEFITPSAIAIAGDSIAVWEPGRGLATWFSGAGRYLRQDGRKVAPIPVTARYLGVGYGAPGRMRLAGDRVLLSLSRRPVRQAFALHGLIVLAVGVRGTDTLVDFATDSTRLRELASGAQELVAVPLWDACPGAGQVVHYSPAWNRLSRVTTDGRLIRMDSIEGATIPLTEETLRRHVRFQLRTLLAGGKQPQPEVEAEMIESMLRQSRDPRMFPDQQPTFTNLICDDSRRVWLQHFSLDESGKVAGSDWLVVDSDGARAEVALPGGFELRAVSGEKLWGIVRDSLGVVSIARIRHGLPG